MVLALLVCLYEVIDLGLVFEVNVRMYVYVFRCCCCLESDWLQQAACLKN